MSPIVSGNRTTQKAGACQRIQNVCPRFSADDALVELSNRFSVLKTVNVDQVCLGQGSKQIKSVPDITGSKYNFFIVGQ
jgi:hypothetical protein